MALEAQVEKLEGLIRILSESFDGLLGLTKQITEQLDDRVTRLETHQEPLRYQEIQAEIVDPAWAASGASEIEEDEFDVRDGREDVDAFGGTDFPS